MQLQLPLPVEPAPMVVFRHLDARADDVRFDVPEGYGPRDADERPTTVRWATHAAAIRHAACFLAGVGVGAGERGAIFAANRVEWMEAALAIEAAGAALVPVYPATTVDGLRYILEHGDVTVLFVDGEALLERALAALAEPIGVRVLVLLDALDLDGALARAVDADTLTPARARALAAMTLRWQEVLAAGAARDAADRGAFEARLAALPLDAAGVMLYTSGTTGRPKGVPLTHRNVGVNGNDWLLCNAPLVEPGDVDLLWLPMSHIFGFGEVCLGHNLGFRSVMSTPAAVLADLARVRPHVFMSVPAYWDKLASLAAAAGPDADAVGARLRALVGDRLRFCLSGGAGLDRAVKTLFHRHGLLIIEGYGLTEASPTLTLNRPDRYRFDSVGLPLPSVELRLGDDGEILARGPSIFGGYHKAPDATAAAFDAEGWLRTGDLGHFTDDGFLQIIGRKKEILVTAGGKNVPPANIEQRFADDPLIVHVMVYGDGRRYLVAGIWLDPVEAARRTAGMAADEAARALHDAVAARVEAVNQGLERYMTIKRFAVLEPALTVEDGMLTATLKLRRKAIEARFGARLAELYA